MKRRRLSQDERSLWRRATKDVAPLKQPLPGLPLGEPPAIPVGEPPSLPVGERRAEEMTPVKSRKAAPSAKKDEKKSMVRASAFIAGDPALDRQARRGKRVIERTLDLHGFRQEAARARLMTFLEQAARDGCRCVLVITGKGGSGASGDEASSSFFAERSPRGIIRTRFREWIDEEPLRSLIARAAPAQPRDGGSGAFYVFLKKKAAASRGGHS